MNEIQKIYETELAEIGYLEKTTNAYLDDKTKNDHGFVHSKYIQKA